MRKISTKRKRVNRKLKLSANKLQLWAKAVKRNDTYKCRSCCSRKNLHAHHLVSKFYRPQWAYDVSNGITLCGSCHLKNGGVHHKKSSPKNLFIKKLREIFKLNDIQSARKMNKNIPIIIKSSSKSRRKLKRTVKRKL